MTLTLNQPAPMLPLTCACCLGSWQTQTAAPEQKMRVLRIAIVLLSSLFAAELAIALQSHSLSLLADAGHLCADVAAMAITLLAVWLAQRPANDRATFGHQRVEILAALLNGVGLFAIAGYVLWETLERWQTTQIVLGLPMLLGAIVGLTLNSVNVCLLWQQSRDDLNLRGALLHVVSDAASSIGVIVASLTIYLWHWMWMDTAASLLVAVLTSLSALPLIKQSLRILLNYAPPEVDPSVIKAAIIAFPAVQAIENLRVFSVTSAQVMLTAQIKVTPALDAVARDRLLHQIQTDLQAKFAITQIVLQVQGSDHPLHPLFSQNLTAHVLGITRKTED